MLVGETDLVPASAAIVSRINFTVSQLLPENCMTSAIAGLDSNNNSDAQRAQ
jgi:hypothetical protein